MFSSGYFPSAYFAPSYFAGSAPDEPDEPPVNPLQVQLDAIEEKLNSGVTSVTVDGTTTVINHGYLRKRANDLRKRIAAERGRRPVASSIFLGGF